MRMGLAVGAIALIGSAAQAGGPALTGFPALAAQGELIEVRRPLFRDGKLRVGDAAGSVRRRAIGRTQSDGAFGVTYSAVDRSGTIRFAVSGAAVGGTVTGDCNYGRSERRVEEESVTLAEPMDPLRMRCDFARDGRGIGYLRLGADRRADPALSARDGVVEVNGTRLGVRSAHRLGERGVATETPVGYWIEDGAGPVAAVDTNGLTRVRLALPRDPARRDAALMAGIALATFWDPGDTDD
jgi:hypothetical protein